MNAHYPISTIMTTKIKSVIPEAIMTDVSDIFENNPFHHLPVISRDNKIVGIISRHDYYQLQHHFTKRGLKSAIASNKKLFASLCAQEVMTKAPVTLDKDQSILEAIDIFLLNRFRAIIVTDEDICVGIITPYDLLRELKKLTEVLQ